MDLLLDTRVFLWWDKQDPVLHGQVPASVPDPANRVFVSAASVWEIAIKRRRGGLAFLGSPVAAVAVNGFNELPILGADAEGAEDLSWGHNDPFDRLLVARARRLTTTLVTAYKTIRAFGGVARLWAG